MQHDEAMQFCSLWLPAWTGNQPEKLLEFYAEDIYYSDPAKFQGIRGKDNLFKYFQKLLAKYPLWVWNAIEVFPFEQGFILKWEAKLDPNQPAFFGLDIVEIKNKKIVRNEVFFDTVHMNI